MIGHISVGNARLALELAEVALESVSTDNFRQEALARIARFVGADASAFFSTEKPGHDISFTQIGCGAAPPNRYLQDCIGEISSDEFGRALRSKAIVDREAISADRRERLLAYREYLPSFGVKTYAMRAWITDCGIAWLTFGRTGHCDQRRFLTQATAVLDAIFPIIALGERAQSAKRLNGQAGLTPHHEIFTISEARVVDLLVKGFTNREIGTLLGISPNTVRNRVATAFKRVGATRRAELVCLLQCDARISV